MNDVISGSGTIDGEFGFFDAMTIMNSRSIGVLNVADETTTNTHSPLLSASPETSRDVWIIDY